MSDLVRQSGTEGEQHPIRPLTDDLMEFLAKLGLLGFLLFWSIVLIRPFLSIVLWSLILTVTLYPAFDWIARLLGDRRKLSRGHRHSACSFGLHWPGHMAGIEYDRRS